MSGRDEIPGNAWDNEYDIVARLRRMSEQVNAGHDRYIPNLADDAADEIERLRWRLTPGHNVYELANQPGTWVAHNGPDALRRGDSLYVSESMDEAIDLAREAAR